MSWTADHIAVLLFVAGLAFIVGYCYGANE
jgi:hypothetical protein